MSLEEILSQKRLQGALLVCSCNVPLLMKELITCLVISGLDENEKMRLPFGQAVTGGY